MSDLDRQLERIAAVPVLLVASDYDGTLSPIVSDPDEARPQRESIVALRRLAAMPQTHVAVISGRALKDLARLTGLPEDVHLVGSHGSEFDLDFAMRLPPEAARLRDRLAQELSEVAGKGNGFIIETKPASVAFHYRNAPEDEAAAAVKSVMDGPAQLEGVYTKHGKKVVELGVVSTSKGTALETMRHRCGASAVAFLGDDVTDEDAFATLTGPDVGIKVGPGPTGARYRVEGPGEVAKVLARLCELRGDWLAGAEAVPIERHSMLSDQRTAALVTPEGRITWMCMPRIDSPAIFAELLGGPAAGHFTIRAPDDGGTQPKQSYRAGSMVLRTKWKDFTVTDFLDCSGGRVAHRAGRTDLVRIIEGTGRFVVEFAPRLEFGRFHTRLIAREGGLEIEDTPDPIVLRSPGIDWTIVEEGVHQTARAEVDLARSRGPQVFELRYGTGSLRDPSATAEERCHQTDVFWKGWAARLTIPDVEPSLVARSALVLKALCHGPSGAIVAAATTSLPEHVGGVRNWDYRFSWLRDGAMAAAALVRLGSTAEAMQFLDWVLGVVGSCPSPERLHPVYAVTGEPLGPEADIGELAGYRGSRPVRVGNMAARQVQLDVFGPIVELVALLLESDAPLSSEHWRLVETMAQSVQRRWREPDHGIWEIRRPRRHHVHSKVMCWLTVDRAVRIARTHLDRDRDDWVALRDEIAADVLEHGYKPDLNAFTAAYDGADLDAASLAVGRSGLLGPGDPRFAGTVKAVEERLRNGPTVYRYRTDDGLPGFEGGFHLCASWLVDSYLLLGRRDEARALFDQIAALAGPTGLLSEEYGPRTGRALGNFPQAYSHIGIIENAVRLGGTGGLPASAIHK